MERVLRDTKSAVVVALFWPAGKPVSQDCEPPDRTFTLVSTLADYEALTAAGHNSILVQRRPSSHFSVPLLVRAAGPLIVPWRWRRVLLNEGVSAVVIAGSWKDLPIVVAMWLARSKPILWRDATARRTTMAPPS